MPEFQIYELHDARAGSVVLKDSLDVGADVRLGSVAAELVAKDEVNRRPKWAEYAVWLGSRSGMTRVVYRSGSEEEEQRTLDEMEASGELGRKTWDNRRPVGEIKV